MILVKTKLQQFLGRVITDLYITGFCELDEGKMEFIPDRYHLFLEIENENLFLINAYKRRGSFEIKDVDVIVPCIEIEDEDYFCFSSILKEDLSSIKILTIDLYTIELDNKLICQGINLNLERNQSLFLDPFNFGGIEVGNDFDKEKWINSHSNKTIIHDFISIDVELD